LHGLSLAVAAFLLVLVATILGFLTRETAIGAPCSAEVRRVEMRDPTGALQLAPRVAAATLETGTSLRTHLLGSQRVPDPGQASGQLSFVRASDALLHALCLHDPAGLREPTLSPGPRGFSGDGLEPPTGVELTARISGFRGVAGIGEGAVWVRDRDVSWLRLDPDNWEDVLLVQRRPGQSWRAIEQEVAQLIRARPDLFAAGTQARWVLASGVDTDALGRAARGLVLLGLVAGGILTLVVANLSVYFVGRHPRFATTATVLAVLGLSRWRLTLMAAFEPALLVILALPVGTWAARTYLRSQPGFDHAVIDLWPPTLAALMLGLGVALVAWRRVAATRASLRPGVAGLRRLSGRLASVLVLVQLAAAVPLLALSLQAGIGWLQAQPARSLQPPSDLWMARWHRSQPAPSPSLAEAIAAIERDDPGVAIAANILPLPGGRIPPEEVTVDAGGGRLAVSRNQVTPKFLELALGLPAERAHAWLAPSSGNTPPVVLSQSLAIALSTRSPLLTLTLPSPIAPQVTTHDIVGVVPDLASMWTGKAEHSGVVITRWDETASAASGVLLIQSTHVPVERFHRAATRLGAQLGEMANVGTLADRALQSERQMAQAFGLMAVVGIASMLVGLVSVLRGIEVAKALEFSVRFALGASRVGVASTHLRTLARPAALGALVGLAAAALATLMIAGRRPLLEPLVIPASLAAMLAVAALAVICALASASRVSRRNPMPALRSE
jgi:hypothetical protein